MGSATASATAVEVTVAAALTPVIMTLKLPRYR